MSEPPTQRPAPEGHPPQTYPPQNYPPQNNPPQQYPPQNPPPQSYPPQQHYPQHSPPQNFPPNPTSPYPVPPQYRPAPRKPSEELRRDTEAALAARMELGSEYTEYIAAGLAERMEDLAAVRAAELRHEAELSNREQAAEQSGRKRQFALAIVSLVMGIPITGITASEVDPALVGVAVSWAGIVGVNWIHARSLRKRK
jgi:hypothetical protein